MAATVNAGSALMAQSAITTNDPDSFSALERINRLVELELVETTKRMEQRKKPK